MAEAKETKGSKKARKKKWFSIVADKLFENAPLGESLLYSADQLNGRVISANLMTLTNDIKAQNVNVKFKINEISGDQAIGSIVSYELMPSSIRRMVRKNVERIDASFVAKTKDEKLVRIKPLLVTKTKTSVNKARLLRRQSIEYIVSQINHSTYEDFARLVLGRGIQTHLRGYLKKSFPLKACEIRSFNLTTTGIPVRLIGDRIVYEERARKEKSVIEKDKTEEQ
jgi:small subunit ribosomal protein S3Ae